MEMMVFEMLRQVFVKNGIGRSKKDLRCNGWHEGEAHQMGVVVVVANLETRGGTREFFFGGKGGGLQ